MGGANFQDGVSEGFDMRILVLMIIGLLVAGNAAAGKERSWDRGGYQSYAQSKAQSKADYRAMKRSWRKSAREYRSSRLNYLRASNLNSGVCDVLEGSSRSLRMMCIAFCELQSCSPDFTAEDPFESCARSSKWIYNRYEKKRGAGDPEMPCVSQPLVAETPAPVAACPCWSAEELSSQLRYAADTDVTRCTVDGTSGDRTNVDTLIVSGGAAYSLSMSSFGSYNGAPACLLSDTCRDGSCLINETRLMEINAAQLTACETDIANAALERNVACN